MKIIHIEDVPNYREMVRKLFKLSKRYSTYKFIEFNYLDGNSTGDEFQEGDIKGLRYAWNFQEDNAEDNEESLINTINGYDNCVVFCDSKATAEILLKKVQFDIALVDIQLRESDRNNRDGLELIQLINGSATIRHNNIQPCPTLVFSVHSRNKQIIDKAKELKIDISKLFRKEDLKEENYDVFWHHFHESLNGVDADVLNNVYRNLPIGIKHNKHENLGIVTEFFHRDTVLYFSGDGNLTTVFFRNGSTHSIGTNLGTVHAYIRNKHPNFIRCGDNMEYLVNLEQINLLIGRTEMIFHLENNGGVMTRTVKIPSDQFNMVSSFMSVVKTR